MTSIPSKTALTGASTTEGAFRTAVDDLIDYLTENLSGVGGGVISVVNATGTTSVPLTVKGIASQSANIFRVRDSGDSDLLAVAADGDVLIGTADTSHLLNVGGKVQSRTATPGFELHDGTNAARIEIDTNELRIEAPDASTLRISGAAGANLTGATIRVAGIDEDILHSGSSGILTETSVNTLSNKTIDLTDNTLTGTVAEFNAAISDGDMLTAAEVATLTNKTIALGSNTISGTLAQFNTALTDGTFATLAGSETLVNKSLTSPTLTGTPVAPTAAVDTSTTQIATTAFVQAQLANDYTAADVLTKLLTVDGDGSGLDADKVGGVDNAYVLKADQTASGRLDTDYSDWNDVITNGMWDVVAWSTNIPTNGPTGAADYGLLMVLETDPLSGGSRYVQMYMTAGTADTQGIWVRFSNVGPNWTDWVHIMSDDSSATNENLTSSTSIALSFTGASKKSLTLDHNTTITVSGERKNQTVEVWITQGSTGGTAAWSGVNKWIGGSAPTLSTTAGEIDIIVLSCANNGTTVVGSHVGVAS